MEHKVTQSLVSVEGLVKTYQGVAKPILSNLSLEVPKGSFSLIIGRSGSGKSTLLHCIAGLEQFEEGSIRVANYELGGRSVEELARIRLQKIGIVFQFFNLIGSLNLEQNILLPTFLAKLSPKDARTRLKDLCSLMEIEGLLEKYPHEVSGGEAQRAAIARALILQPELVLADEPTGNLDEESANTVFRLFEKAVSELQATVLMVSHDTTFVPRSQHVFELTSAGISQ